MHEVGTRTDVVKGFCSSKSQAIERSRLRVWQRLGAPVRILAGLVARPAGRIGWRVVGWLGGSAGTYWGQSEGGARWVNG